MLPTSCSEDIDFGKEKHGNKNEETKNYPAHVAMEWMTLHVVKLTRFTPGFNGLISNRSFGYTGLVLYEAVVPGMKDYQSMSSQLNGMPHMPKINKKLEYHWPTSANAALAAISRSLFPNTAANNITIDSLEAAYNERYQQDVEPETFDRSVTFGKEVAAAIFEWSKTDGGHEAYLHNTDDSFIPPTGEGLWIPTPPAFGKSFQPYWGNHRPFIAGIVDKSQPGPPIPYSTDPSSPFFLQVKEVYTFSQHLTPEQITIAKYWNDSPVTYNVPGHATHILTQILLSKKGNLADAAVAYAKHGIAMNDGVISCFKTKY